MLRLTDVSVNYGAFRALHDVTLHVGTGELVVLLGANGAGKSTIFKTISGLLTPRSGAIRMADEEIAGRKPASIVAAGLVHCPEGRSLFPRMSILKNLMLGAYVHRGRAAEVKRSLDEVFSLFPILAERRSMPAGSLSGGQQQMVAIGRALMGRPELLLLDEPSVGIAPRLKGLIFDAIQQIRKDGTAILIVEQDATSTLRITDRVYVLEHGRTIREGTPKDLAGDKYIQQVYLG
ncbi:MAG: ABC transporter ATP-binding protein, partial [Beijerinckiaceae bacterium]|nr:ABC transporter ATP-binding protein [Beijerinckiaceae bacterium]